jgi:hypothetical protein
MQETTTTCAPRQRDDRSKDGPGTAREAGLAHPPAKTQKGQLGQQKTTVAAGGQGELQEVQGGQAAGPVDGGDEQMTEAEREARPKPKRASRRSQTGDGAPKIKTGGAVVDGQGPAGEKITAGEGGDAAAGGLVPGCGLTVAMEDSVAAADGPGPDRGLAVGAEGSGATAVGLGPGDGMSRKEDEGVTQQHTMLHPAKAGAAVVARMGSVGEMGGGGGGEGDVGLEGRETGRY